MGKVLVNAETTSATELTTVQTRINPIELMQTAIEKGIDLKELLDFQERYEATEARKAYTTAMNLFKQNVPDIIKNKKVSFGQTRYKHATLFHVCDVITGSLGKYGLSHKWEIQQASTIGVECDIRTIKVICIITHELGHSEKTEMSAPNDTSGSKNAIQEIASTVTYLERYTLLAAVGMAARDQDDDGQAAAPATVDNILIEASQNAAAKGLDNYTNWYRKELTKDQQTSLYGDGSETTEHAKRKEEAEAVDLQGSDKELFPGDS